MKTRQVLKFVFREFIHGGHLQCLSFASIAFISGLLLNIEITFEFLIIVYLIFYPIYIYNRFKEGDTDELTNPGRVRHLRNYIKHIPVIFCLSIFLLVVCLVYFSNFVFLIFALLLLFGGISYTITIKNATQKLIGFKNFYVAAFFSSIVISPIIYYPHFLVTFSSAIPIIIFAIFVYFKALAIQVLLDIKDIESDKKIGLLTIPIVFGMEKTISFLKLFSVLITGSFIIIFFFLDIFPGFINFLTFARDEE